jgi:uncharacterized protein
MKRLFSLVLAIGIMVIGSTALAQKKTVLISIASGMSGGVYYAMAGGMAEVMSKYVSYLQATPEMSPGSVDNCLLIEQKKVELALIMADTGWDASLGKGRFKEKIPLRTLAVVYPNNMHVLSLEGKGIEKITDMRGKRVSTSAPGSGTEILAQRILEIYGLNPDKDMKREKLGPGEAAGALKDRKIDAYFWVGGLPASAVTDLAATPGIKVKFIPHADVVPGLREKYGPLYVKGIIPGKTYPGQNEDVPIVVVWNLLVCHENMKDDVVYDITKSLFEHKPELVMVHGDARHLSLETQTAGGSPIPFHPGAIRYFTERGLKVK